MTRVNTALIFRKVILPPFRTTRRNPAPRTGSWTFALLISDNRHPVFPKARKNVSLLRTSGQGYRSAGVQSACVGPDDPDLGFLHRKHRVIRNSLFLQLEIENRRE